MNSKERVATALLRKTPDKVPYGEFAIDFDTAEKILERKTYYRNKAGIMQAVWDESRWDEMAESVVEDGVELVETLDQDIVTAAILPPRDIEKPRQVDDTTWEYKDGRVLKYSAATNDFTVVHWPERDYLPTDADIEAAAEGHPFEEYRLAPVRRMVERFGGEKYIVAGVPSEAGMPLFGGMENGLMYYLTDPGRMKAWIEASLVGESKADEVYRGLGVDAALWGTDFAYNAGPLLPPRVFAELLMPAAKERTRVVHEMGLGVIQHACGNNWELLDFFVEIGIDGYQSIQKSAGMDIKLVKEYYGSKLALWGGMPVEDLVSGTSADVVQDVRYAMEHAKPGGGFIFGSSHSVAVGTKYENYRVMLDEFWRLRDY